jgi:hypothetical protein
MTWERELFVGSYLRRTDGAHVRVVRLEGTKTYRAYVNGRWVETGSRGQCMKRALR